MVVKLITKICRGCKKEFKTHKKRKVFCKELCRDSFSRKKIIKKTILKVCKICEKEFKTTKPRKFYCSKSCCNKKQKERKLFKKENGEITTWVSTRFSILNRDNYTCQYCGFGVDDGKKLVIDHIIPRAKQGTNNKNNLITSCTECNCGKSDILLSLRQIEKLKNRIELKNKK